MTRITLKDIAKKAGVSHATVSMALRGLPKIPTQTRERIKKIADEMGYVPDPILSRLNAYRTHTIESAPQAAIAWINFWKDPDAMARNNTFQQYLLGAKDMAKLLGYRIEEMTIHKEDMTLERVESILHSRNITGILIPPAENFKDKSIDLTWERYSVVKFGYSMSGVKAHLITNTQFETARLVYRKAVEKGFTRIGYHLNSRGSGRTYKNFLAGFLLATHSHPHLQSVAPIIMPAKDESKNHKAFIKWFRKNKPECILTQNERVIDWLSDEGVRVPEDVSVFHFALPCAGTTNFSGVQQNSFNIGQEAVAWLDRLMRIGNAGEPDKPLELLVQGEWIDGDTG